MIDQQDVIWHGFRRHQLVEETINSAETAMNIFFVITCPLARFEQHVLDHERNNSTSKNYNAIPWPIDTRDDEYKKRGPITDFTIPEDDVNAADPNQRPSHLVYVQSFLQRVPIPPAVPLPLPQVTTNPIINQPSTRTKDELERSLLSAQEEIRVLRMQQVSPQDNPSLNTKVSITK